MVKVMKCGRMRRRMSSEEVKMAIAKHSQMMAPMIQPS